MGEGGEGPRWPDVADTLARIRRFDQRCESPFATRIEWKRAREMSWIATLTKHAGIVPNWRLNHGGNPRRRSRVRGRKILLVARKSLEMRSLGRNITAVALLAPFGSMPERKIRCMKLPWSKCRANLRVRRSGHVCLLCTLQLYFLVNKYERHGKLSNARGAIDDAFPTKPFMPPMA